MPVLATRGISALLACSGCVSLFAEVVTLNPVADTCLFEFDPDFNFGRQRDLPGGTLGLMGNSSRCRVLYKFDLAAVPAGATIESARLTLAITSQLPVGRQVSDFALSRVLVDWGEGDGFGERPGGREALPAEATWNHRFHPGEGQTAIPWAEPGGEFGVDFASARSGMAENVDGSRSNPTSYVFEFNPT
ncbi:MAG: hypothetical protein GWO24_25605, partial [Akkermansiaceae bacterium]|nr:hypothetical protein [Akkermansiaceae bacterium]